MRGQAERSVFLCICVLPTELVEGTEVYAINEIPTSYSFLRRAIPCGYLPVLPLYSLVLGQYFIHMF